MVIRMTFFSMMSGPCRMAVAPVQPISVAVALGVKVGSAVLVEVAVGGGGCVVAGVTFGILTEVGM